MVIKVEEYQNIEGGGKKRKKSRKKSVIILLILFVCLFNIFFGADRVRRDVTVTIPEGSGIVEIANLISKSGAVKKKYKLIDS